MGRIAGILFIGVFNFCGNMLLDINFFVKKSVLIKFAGWSTIWILQKHCRAQGKSNK